MHKKNQIITLLFIGIVVLLLASIAPLEVDASDFFRQEDSILYDYSFQGLMILKIGMVLYSTYLVLYGWKINDYDVYLYIRRKPEKVHMYKIAFLLRHLWFVSSILASFYALFLVVLPNYYPISFVWSIYKTVWIFTAYYSILLVFIAEFIRQIGGVFIPFVGYLIGMIFMDINSTGVIQPSKSNYIQIFVPDIIYGNNRFFFLFGDYIVIAECFVFLFLVIHIFRRRDWF